jgi:hypothetical protein
MHDHHDLDCVGAQPVNDAVALINHFPDMLILGFGHRPAAKRGLLRQMIGDIVDDLLNGLQMDSPQSLTMNEAKSQA